MKKWWECFWNGHDWVFERRIGAYWDNPAEIFEWAMYWRCSKCKKRKKEIAD